jgi:hypothetical protein
MVVMASVQLGVVTPAYVVSNNAVVNNIIKALRADHKELANALRNDHNEIVTWVQKSCG